MQRVNAEYVNRVTKALDNAIGSLRDRSEEGDHDSDDAADLANELEALRSYAEDKISLTLDQDESLRASARRYECERSTKNDDLVKLQKKLRDMREERLERRVELEEELSQLRAVFHARERAMRDEQDLREKSELAQRERLLEAFESERMVLEEKKTTLIEEQGHSRRRYVDEESKLHASISSLRMDIQKVFHDHDLTLSLKKSDIQSLRGQLEKEERRRHELEEHFARVDANNAIKKQEEEAFRKVSELEEKAMALLDNGAVGLQRLWRGLKERELVAKMKSKKKKKGGKSKKKKK